MRLAGFQPRVPAAAVAGTLCALCRTAYELASGEALPRLEVEAVRGLEGIKAATITLPDSAPQVSQALGGCACAALGLPSVASFFLVVMHITGYEGGCQVHI